MILYINLDFFILISSLSVWRSCTHKLGTVYSCLASMRRFCSFITSSTIKQLGPTNCSSLIKIELSYHIRDDNSNQNLRDILFIKGTCHGPRCHSELSTWGYRNSVEEQWWRWAPKQVRQSARGRDGQVRGRRRTELMACSWSPSWKRWTDRAIPLILEIYTHMSTAHNKENQYTKPALWLDENSYITN